MARINGPGKAGRRKRGPRMKTRRDKPDEQLADDWLRAYARRGNVEGACTEVGVSRHKLYNNPHFMPSAEFKRRKEWAHEDFCDRLEATVAEEAIERKNWKAAVELLKVHRGRMWDLRNKKESSDEITVNVNMGPDNIYSSIRRHAKRAAKENGMDLDDDDI